MIASSSIGERLGQVVHIIDLLLLLVSVGVLLMEVFVGALFITMFFICGALLVGGVAFLRSGGSTGMEELKVLFMNKWLIGAYIVIGGLWFSYCVLTYKFKNSGLFPPNMECRLNGNVF
ncbi:hypothetical protein N7468_006663 [Penicillium chermesinum]|uniref:Uncharacterized protein n=1 Tax=Penicillium chermesinum TaxID=63820 RepID=A0A9W9TJW9_9EURO|nr:uncharacterized protein N7468_006663 [Penicillium chermesinum]KAJ5225438.1 hypothetical protein N7468_006663 [Penicillium chermesinum]KAJ6161336.1 hypothetical protein N7470_004732 [Penicillium chermesinum]